ncbi:hypothetical protein [Deinococcus pimensis]|uniref:hypothetical protein n=1 Tax=Deinococcus pimensis TaxID=309888 RepID=UPI0004873DAE|nr:hypothetical protein [Deinococcus pimensis]
MKDVAPSLSWLDVDPDHRRLLNHLQAAGRCVHAEARDDGTFRVTVERGDERLAATGRTLELALSGAFMLDDRARLP